MLISFAVGTLARSRYERRPQVTMRIQEGLGASNPRSTCMLDIEWKAANQTQIKGIEDLKRLLNERNLSLNEAKNCYLHP